MKSDNVTVTDARLKKALQSRVQPIINQHVNPQIEKLTNNSKIQIGFMTKFYPYLDKCEVELNTGKTVLCKILHRFSGELLEFFTPQGDEDYCDKLKEPCIIPMVDLECLVLDVNDNSDEQIVLGYILSNEIVSINPAHPGNMKLSYSNGVNEYWIKFGDEGLDLRLSEVSTVNVGEMDEDMVEVNPISMEKVEALIEEKIDEALGGSR